MSASHKKLRLMIERNGCTVEEFTPGGATFISCTYFAPDGVHKSTARMSKFKNEGNQHGDKNEEAAIRRFARQYPATQIAEQIKEKAPEVFKIVQQLAHPPREETLEEFARRVDAEHEEHDEAQEPQATAGPSPAAPETLPSPSRQAPMEKPKTVTLVPKMNKSPPSKEHMEAMRAKKRLSMVEVYTLVEWVKKNVATEQYATIEEIIPIAGAALEYEVPYAAIEKALKMLALRLKPKPRATKRGPYKKPVVTRSNAGVIELMLIEIGRLQTACHLQPTPEFAALVRAINEEKNNEREAGQAAAG